MEGIVNHLLGQFVALLRECFTFFSGRERKGGGGVTVFTFLLLASWALCLCSSSLTVVFTRTP